MHKYTFVWIVIIFLLSSCSINNENRSLVKTQNIDSQSINISQNKIIKYLVQIEQSSLPSIVREYFTGQKRIFINEFDNSLVIRDSNRGVSIVLFSSKGNNQMLIFCGYRKDIDQRYENYFFFLRRTGDYWSNITQLLINNDVISILSSSLNSNFRYRKSFDSDFYAYYSDASDYYIKFILKQKEFTLYKSDGKNDYLISKVYWQEGQFRLHHQLFVNQVDSEENQIDIPPPISENQLEQKRRYTDLNTAFESIKDVYILDLTGLGIDSLPASISKLKYLQILILNDNFLETLPDEICQLPNLQILRASDNNLEHLPSALGNLKNLEELTVNNNSLEYLPISLTELKNLKILNLANNKLKTLIVDFSRMPNLTILNLRSNKFVSLPRSIAKLKNLQSLDISDNPIKVLPNFIFKLKYLSYINIKNTQIPKSQIEKLENTYPDAIIVY